MGLFIDRLFNNSKQLIKVGEFPQTFIDQLRNVHVINAQNVADYFFSSPQDHWDWVEDFPNVAPPFHSAWIDWKDAEQMNLNGKIEHIPTELQGENGLLMTYLESKFWREASDEEKLKLPRWVLIAQMFTYNPHTPRIICNFGFAQPVKFLIPVSQTGQIMVSPIEDDILKPTSKLMGIRESIKDLMTGASQGVHTLPGEKLLAQVNSGKLDPEFLTGLPDALNIPLLTVSFMHCKNVKKVEDQIPKKREQERRIQKGKIPLVKSYTLVLNPLKEIIRSANGGSESLTPKALHICRGHFRSYTEEKPLFGKLAGQFYIPQHVRGDISQGEIKKDYSIDLDK